MFLVTKIQPCSENRLEPNTQESLYAVHYDLGKVQFCLSCWFGRKGPSTQPTLL